jgi:ABC-type sugar transport system ATPase subunit
LASPWNWQQIGLPCEENVVEIHNLEIEDPRCIYVFNLDVKAGEVIGLAVWKAADNVILARFGGYWRRQDYKTACKGHDLTHEPYSSYLKTGVAYVPADRMEEGLIPDLH